MESIDFLEKSEQELLLSSVKNRKHKVLILLMLDAGMRVSEARTLKWENCDFRNRIVTVFSLKKRDKKENRKIPISQRLYNAFSDLIEECKSTTGYIFQGKDGKPIGRQAVNNMLNRLENDVPSLTEIHPHKLRHSFATNLRLVDAPLEDIKDLLGHSDLNTTFIYAHSNTDRQRNFIDSSAGKLSVYEKIKSLFVPNQNRKINLIQPDFKMIFGRDKEIKKVVDLVNRNVSILITGEIGIGKTHLLNSLEFDKPTLLIDDTKEFKKSIVTALKYLYERDDSTLNLAFKNIELNKFEVKVSSESLPNLIELLILNTQKFEYILKIGDIDGITPTVAKALKMLKDHFVIITTGRKVALNNSDFVWNFEKIELQKLDRINSMRMIYRLIEDLQIENMDSSMTKIYETSDGNPRMIKEISERLRKEPFITLDVVNEVCNSYIGKQTKEMDFSIVLLLILGGFAVLRYVGKESGDKSLTFIGGVIMIILLFARHFFNVSKRRNL
jgi:integrase/recombinase XerD